MSTHERGVRSFVVAGSPERMGHEHGLRFAGEIRRLYEVRLDLLLQAEGVTARDVQAVSRDAWAAITSRTPLIAREVEFVAMAAELEPWQLVVAGAYTDLADVLRATLESASECTVGIDPNRGLVYGTWDSHPEAASAMVVLHRKPENGVETLALTTAGWPCQFGINAFGLAYGITNLTPRVARQTGLAYIAAVAGVSGLATSGLATKWLAEQQFMSGHSYVLLEDHEGAIVETSSESHAIRICHEPCVETNHYISDIDDNDSYRFLKLSEARRSEFSGAWGALGSSQAFESWLVDSVTVLRSPSEHAAAVTCAAFVLDAQNRTMWVATPSELGRGKKSHCFGPLALR